MAARSQLRWRLAGDDPQGALFDEVTHHEGKGEFRGMEFLHVNARTIINEVPASSRVPFRYTINAYRGCSHACTYCLAGDTPVLMADGRTRPIAELKPGDSIYGTVQDGAYRRYVPTMVLAHWTTVKPAFRVTLSDGTELIASGDHRFLSNRGWKHVTGTEQGRDTRPHLTLKNRLIGTGGFPTAPHHDQDYVEGYLCGMIRGDGNLGTYTYLRPNGTPNRVHRFRLALTDLEPLRRTKEFLHRRSVATTEFDFMAATAEHRAITAIRSSRRSAFDSITALVEWPTTPSESWSKGFLAGIFDAEGSSGGGVIRISNSDPRILSITEDCLQRFGFKTVLEPPAPNGCRNVRLRGGHGERLRFYLTVDPATTRKRTFNGLAVKAAPEAAERLRVVGIEALGIEMPMHDITTGTGDFIANGVISHNCFARPTQEYLGLNSGEDFERKIVVKINAVERLRAELRRPAWRGEHIAMGTNTDPYQRCEGKYRLTRGIIETLAEARNPFSILTKSTLILRDLGVLADAAKHTDIHANFSIGTLDDDVWRATEPGTPHPRKRVEAVSKLNEAGIPCGVLVAPVLPGISDDPKQIEAVVKACADAGATSISPILLHLRPGVKEHFMSWLEEAHPDLVDRYVEMYPKSYASKAKQEELAALVQDFRRTYTRRGGWPVGRGPRERSFLRSERVRGPEGQDPPRRASQDQPHRATGPGRPGSQHQLTLEL